MRTPSTEGSSPSNLPRTSSRLPRSRPPCLTPTTPASPPRFHTRRRTMDASLSGHSDSSPDRFLELGFGEVTPLSLNTFADISDWLNLRHHQHTSEPLVSWNPSSVSPVSRSVSPISRPVSRLSMLSAVSSMHGYKVEFGIHGGDEHDGVGGAWEAEKTCPMEERLPVRYVKARNERMALGFTGRRRDGGGKLNDVEVKVIENNARRARVTCHSGGRGVRRGKHRGEVDAHVPVPEAEVVAGELFIMALQQTKPTRIRDERLPLQTRRQIPNDYSWRGNTYTPDPLPTSDEIELPTLQRPSRARREYHDWYRNDDTLGLHNNHDSAVGRYARGGGSGIYPNLAAVIPEGPMNDQIWTNTDAELYPQDQHLPPRRVRQNRKDYSYWHSPESERLPELELHNTNTKQSKEARVGNDTGAGPSEITAPRKQRNEAAEFGLGHLSRSLSQQRKPVVNSREYQRTREGSPGRGWAASLNNLYRPPRPQDTLELTVLNEAATREEVVRKEPLSDNKLDHDVEAQLSRDHTEGRWKRMWARLKQSKAVVDTELFCMSHLEGWRFWAFLGLLVLMFVLVVCIPVAFSRLRRESW
ncbi:hypothetical protein EX30DRAFT_365780 [Ascodesmis nigricans]|uniref:Uncharacterized protein n=1 Tax=Ascodesmis nigricans TaxID=341454 RepID=A0A4S2MSH5_9PEZI|nr:hypothetical protein EX30DRAFT_365780 [Ascodesmis nigricans]